MTDLQSRILLLLEPMLPAAAKPFKGLIKAWVLRQTDQELLAMMRRISAGIDMVSQPNVAKTNGDQK